MEGRTEVEGVMEVEEVIDVEGSVDVEGAADVEDVPSGISGFGHTFSMTASGQYSAIVLYRYHCRSNEIPEG